MEQSVPGSLLLLTSIFIGFHLYDVREEYRITRIEDLLFTNEKIQTEIMDRFGADHLEKSRSALRKVCTESSITNCSLIPPFVQYESRQMIAPDFALSACVIYKNMSTVLTAIMCYLYDMVGYRQRVQDMAKDTYSVRACRGRNEYSSMRIFDRIHPTSTNSTWTHIFVAREPKERLISGFVNKCIKDKWGDQACYNCGEDLRCFMEAQYSRYMNGTASKTVFHTVEDAHFAPQNWYCELKENYNRLTFLRYSGSDHSSIFNEIDRLMTINNVPIDVREDIRKQLLGRHTFHATFDDPLREKYDRLIEEDRYLQHLMLKMFFYDYVLFGFPLPNFV